MIIRYKKPGNLKSTNCKEMSIHMNNIRKTEGIHIVRSLILLIVITLVTISTGLAQNKPQAKKESQLDSGHECVCKTLAIE